MAVVNNNYIPEWKKAQQMGTNQYATYNQNGQQAQQMAAQQSGAIKTSAAKTSNTASIAALKPAASYAYGTDPGNYTNRYGAALDDIYKQIQNRKKFKYEFNADPLFNSYKDLYLENGKQASLDAMGQAAQLTGGYGNSYAQQVGQQTNQQYQRQLYDIGLDLRDRAYQMNQDELANLYNMANMYQQAEATDYARYQDAMAAWQAAQEAAAMAGGGGGSGGGKKVYYTGGRYYTEDGTGKWKEISQDQALNGQYKIYDQMNNLQGRGIDMDAGAKNAWDKMLKTIGALKGTGK